MIPLSRLREMRERAEKATKGPWKANGKETIEAGCRCLSCWIHLDGEWAVSNELDELAEADAEFIASSRTDLPALLDEVERLRAMAAKCHYAIERQGTLLRDTIFPPDVLQSFREISLDEKRKEVGR